MPLNKPRNGSVAGIGRRMAVIGGETFFARATCMSFQRRVHSGAERRPLQ